MTVPVIIVGAGGHARVLLDALVLSGTPVHGFTDSDVRLSGTRVLGYPVLGDDSVLHSLSPKKFQLVNGIGSVGVMTARRRIAEELLPRGWTFATVVHPAATVSGTAKLEPGAQVFAGAIVQTGCRIGIGAIVNSGAIVEHDCNIGSYVHVAPGATLSGNVVIGDESHIGAGAVVIQGIRLGFRTTVGAGAVVVTDDPGEGTLIGVPARRNEK
jgi:sugar O-acyltransferase (sialic acid O-acetyltransferase NeuD family)